MESSALHEVSKDSTWSPPSPNRKAGQTKRLVFDNFKVKDAVVYSLMKIKDNKTGLPQQDPSVNLLIEISI